MSGQGFGVRVLCFFAAITIVCTPAFAQIKPKRQGAQQQNRGKFQRPEIPRALRIALAAVGKVQYQGKRIVVGKEGGMRERHIEIVVSDGPRSRIEFPAGSALAGQVIVETPPERRHFKPDKNELQIMPPRRQEVLRDLGALVKRGMVEQTPGGTVAGFNTLLVTISDRLRNAIQKLWIEPRTGMILKREIYDRSGAIEASFEFTEISFQPVLNDTLFALKPPGVKVNSPEITLQRLIRRGGFQSIQIAPASGYRLAGARIQKIADQDVLVQQYTGNGHRVLLYQLKGSVDPEKLGKLERPDLQIYSWQASGASFVLLGDLSDAELKELARRLGG
jgi:hypothetical protein